MKAERSMKSGAPRADFRLGYMPALDGIRAAAVLGVLVYHADSSWLPGGYFTVDAFFVLSGFLITTLLIAEFRRTGGIALLSFWARRARRLLPALLFLMAGIVLYAAVFATPVELPRLRGDAIASLLYVANWRFVATKESYFDAFVTPSPLRHLWTLAIEEQFYLVWPLVVCGTLRISKGSLRGLFVICVGLAAASALTMAVLYERGASITRLYYGSDTRVQSIAVGAALAVVVSAWGTARTRRGRGRLTVVGTLGFVIAAALWAFASESHTGLFRGGFLLASIAVACVIASVVQPRTDWLTRTLRVRPLAFTGTVSYGLYLWHWPVYVVLNPARTGLAPAPLFALRLAISFVLAVVSYYVVEKPIRERRWPARLSVAAAPIVAAAVLVAILITTSGGLQLQTELDAEPSSVRRNDVPRVLVQGDSVGAFLGEGMVRTEGTYGLDVWNRARWGCSLGLGSSSRNAPPGTATKCPDWHGVFADEVRRFDPDVVVVLFGVLDVFDREVGGRTLKFGSRASDAYYLRLLDQATNILAARGARVIFVASPHPLGARSYWETNEEWSPDQAWRTRHFHDLLRTNAGRHPGIASVLDITPEVCPTTPCNNEVNGVPMRIDGVHWTPQGADLLSGLVATAIERRAR
jgi:peptidoglycan/LPS O-acetylase OafA/YrhL